LSTDNLEAHRAHLGDKCALDSFRRLIAMYANVVHGVPIEIFEYRLAQILSYKYGMDKAPKIEQKMSVKHYEMLVQGYLDEYETYVGAPFPDNIHDQLQSSIAAVFDSWNCERAVKYRKVHGYSDDWGTAVNVQKMVYGNRNDKSGAGVLFSRNPSTGEPGMYGEFLTNAQGEDVVAGVRTPKPIAEMKAWNEDLYIELEQHAMNMEKHYKEMQDMEFTVDDGVLYMLQTRTGKRSAAASFRIAYDMVAEGLIDKVEALNRVNGKQYMVLSKPSIDTNFKTPADITGIGAAGSMVSGVAVFTTEEAEAALEPCILVRKETTPEDFGGMLASVGVLTSTGGATSHAAVVARGMDKTCVVGATELEMTPLGAIVPGGGPMINKLTPLTLDGKTGRVWVNTKVPMIQQPIEGHVGEMIQWATKGQDDGVMLKVTPETVAKCDEPQWQKDFEMQLPTEGTVYLDSTKLAFGKNARYALAKLLSVAASRPELGGIIGMTPDPLPEFDNTFLSFLGVDATKGTVGEGEVFQHQVTALLMKKWTQTLKKRWTLHLPAYATPEQFADLAEAKWQQVRPIKTLGDLMDVNGIMDIDEATTERLKVEGVELKQFVALLKQAGREVTEMPRVLSKDQMVFEVLGG